MYVYLALILSDSRGSSIDSFVDVDFPLPSWRHEARSMNDFDWLSCSDDQSNSSSLKHKEGRTFYCLQCWKEHDKQSCRCAH